MEYGEEFPLHAWSLRQCRMRQWCPRSALLHYRDARGGGDPDAAPDRRLLHALRNTLSLPEYLNRILRMAMREIFYSPHPGDAENLTGFALQRWNDEFSQMLRRDPQELRTPRLLELTRPGCRIAELRKTGERELHERSARLIGGAWGELAETPPESRRAIDSPLALQINDLRCYCAPLCALERNGMLWIIESGHGGEYSALLHKFYALNRCGRDPQGVRSFALDDRSGDLREILIDDVSALLREISADAAGWEELLNTPAEAAPRGKGECQECRFLSFCQEKKLSSSKNLCEAQ